MQAFKKGDRVTYQGSEYRISYCHLGGDRVDLVAWRDGVGHAAEHDVSPHDLVLMAPTAEVVPGVFPDGNSQVSPLATQDDLYDSLRRVLAQAVEQASAGKGVARHAAPGEAFEDQQIVQLGLWMGPDGSTHFNLGQAVKKALEACRLPPDAAKREILGAINYLAGAVLILEGKGLPK